MKRSKNSEKFKELDIGELCKKNPQIDPQRLEESLVLLRLIRVGRKRAEYDLVSPFARRIYASTE